jgi:hypothetical protein
MKIGLLHVGFKRRRLWRAFVDCIENGGCAEKLAIIRAQGKKVAARQQNKAVHRNGRITYSGNIVRNKGDV